MSINKIVHKSMKKHLTLKPISNSRKIKSGDFIFDFFSGGLIIRT